jgi:hypothetical protein
MVVIVVGTCGTWVCAVMLDGLEAGQGVCEDAYPFVGYECSECRVNGY